MKMEAVNSYLFAQRDKTIGEVALTLQLKLI